MGFTGIGALGTRDEAEHDLGICTHTLYIYIQIYIYIYIYVYSYFRFFVYLFMYMLFRCGTRRPCHLPHDGLPNVMLCVSYDAMHRKAPAYLLPHEPLLSNRV